MYMHFSGKPKKEKKKQTVDSVVFTKSNNFVNSISNYNALSSAFRANEKIKHKFNHLYLIFSFGRFLGDTESRTNRECWRTFSNFTRISCLRIELFDKYGKRNVQQTNINCIFKFVYQVQQTHSVKKILTTLNKIVLKKFSLIYLVSNKFIIIPFIYLFFYQP